MIASQEYKQKLHSFPTLSKYYFNRILKAIGNSEGSVCFLETIFLCILKVRAPQGKE